MRGHRKRGEPRPGAAVHRVPGERAVTELLAAAPGRIRRVLVRAGVATTLVEQCEAVGVRVDAVGDRELDAHVPPGLSRGVLALADPPPDWDLLDLLTQARDPAQGRAVVVALDGVQDPRNLGAIVRSCEFFGVHGLVWPRDRAAGLSPAAVRASAGACERLPLCQVTNLARALETCQNEDFWVLGTVVDAGEPLRTLVAQDRLPRNLVVVMGAEERGLRRLTRSRCDYLANIPRRGHVGSLNVAAAAAVTLALLD